MDESNSSLRDKLQGHQNKLLQLTKSNRCICIKKLYKKHNFDLAQLLENNSKHVDELVTQAFEHKKPICILPDADNSEEAIRMRKHLQTLARNIKQSEDETGSQYCYFGFPFLEGHITTENYVRGPLALFPISVYYGQIRNKMGWYVKFLDQTPIFNHTLFTALEKIGNYQLSQSFESDFEEIVTNFTTKKFEDEFTQKILQLLKDIELPVEISKPIELDSDKDNILSTSKLKDMTTADIDGMDRCPLRIVNYKIIGSFPQGESAIYHDYENLISKIDKGEKNDFISDMLGEIDTPPEYAEDDGTDIDELDSIRSKELNLILPSDSSQDKVVLASQHKKATIVRGPPGTGKSQVIVNIIANALSKGQKVLVVCQKRAALEVVHQRLDEKNLGKYTILLNKEKDDRAKMYQQMKQILDEASYSEQNNQRHLENVSNDLDKLVLKHSKIFHALSKKYFGGLTVKELYADTSSDYVRKLDLNDVINSIQYADLESFLYDISNIEDSYKKFENDDYAWKNRKSFADVGSADKNKLAEILTKAITNAQNCIVLQEIHDQDSLIKLVKLFSTLRSEHYNIESEISKCIESIKHISDLHKKDAPTDNLNESISCVDSGLILWYRLESYEKILQTITSKIVIDDYSKHFDLFDAFSDPVEKKSLWKKMTDSDTKRKNKLKKKFIEAPENIVRTHEELYDLLKNGLELWDAAREHPHLKEYIFDKTFLLDNKDDQSKLLEELVSLKKHQTELKLKSEQLDPIMESLQKIFDDNDIVFDRDMDPKQLFFKVTNGRNILDQINSLSEFVTEKETASITSKLADCDMLLAHIRNLDEHLSDFYTLQSYDIKKQDLSKEQQMILKQCISSLPIDEDWDKIIKQEIYHHWIESIEKDNPVLREGFDDYKQNQERLASLMEKKSNMIIKMIINAIESHAGFKPGMGNKRTKREIEYGSLRHELGKKRRVKPVRELFKKFEHILFDIAPCWLASPEMVSNIFPLEEHMFDLIIVDEASQLAAERSLPFLYRGERIVIAGDEKQLKPHDLFQIKGDDSEEYEEVNIESLLLLARKRGYTQTTLQWHYRSKWQELIDFSNHAFYNNLLRISPNVQIKPPSPPIQWIDCPKGLWENRSNVAEASKVVDALYGILLDHDGKENPTLGIITFNDEQRNTILDEIEVRKRKDPAFDQLYKKVEMPPSGKKDDEIFVRNIENVQGDERDIIIFSIGYAKDFEGNFRLQFGTLNMDGGENRLNVAVTRASNKIIVVSSIDPRDMKVENTKNPGPKRLKDFLTYAKAISDNNHEEIDQILESLSSGMTTQQTITRFDSPFEELVYDRLKALGYLVDTQVGQSGYRIDLAIVHPKDPSRYVMGIECDGAMFHSGKSVRERDVTRQQFLERRGWKIDRIWSRNWWKNPEKEIQRIKARIELLVRDDAIRRKR